MALLLRLILIALALSGVVLVAARLGAFSGRPPSDLGVRDGRLKPPSTTPNSVSSQASLYPDHPQRAYAQVEPYPLRGTPAEAMADWAARIAAQPGARIVDQREDYLRAEFTTAWMRYVDDVELWADAASGVIHVRSASRLGHGDLGLNRRRIEALRAGSAP
ncbi:DUF1499 domain-containing protein [Sphaerotilus mobilis]|uniref:Uncharacterized protein (DUF1499 family) n=1 Tax=Sphaerotilus mobilis TaxID=47994 RepID=A0A4Q7LQ08_9BURK|nr:DUF1499 domain-containing protein [Sphaerotilus mobilis]RZS56654.1 uncharacterized protein (DUF1499 family) [Sphaerotilus mobilis]